MSYIELKNITFKYSNPEKQVFDNFNMSVNEGEFVIIKGDNGSGKTTLFRILNGLEFPQSGKYMFNGSCITQKHLSKNTNAKQFHKQIGYLFQNPEVMLFNSTVYDEIAFGPRQMMLDDNLVNERVDGCLRIFDIEELCDKAPYHLSGGEQKKVALASIMSLNPDVYIMDEPFSGLDQKAIENLIKLIVELNEAGKTVILSSHNNEIIDKFPITKNEIII